MSLYVALKLVHVLGVGVFLFAHGVSGGASLLLRRPPPGSSRQLLELSQRSSMISNPALVLVLITGVWMGFAGSLWNRGWIWATIVVLVLVIASMVYVARPYYMARDASKQSDDAAAERLSGARPLLAVWIGSAGVLLLIALMVLKPF